MLNSSQHDQEAIGLTLDLLRHGAVEGPPALYGSTDILLSEQGWTQMRAVQLEPVYDRIVSSPRRRCLAFAQEKATQLVLPLTVEAGLAEMNFGDWDGVPFTPDAPFWPQLEHFWATPAMHTPPGGESLDGFHERVVSTFRRMIDAEQGHQLWVIHAGVIRAVLAHVLRADFTQPAWHQSLHIGYASLTRLVLKSGHVSVRFIGLPVDHS